MSTPDCSTKKAHSLNTPVIIILGPTGSGKTAIGIELAKKLNGEIISADSRTIYKGLDIGTAKPTKEEQQGIPHHGLNLVAPGTRFTVSDWKTYAEQKIAEIRARGHQPIIVGGTGLYIDALIFDYKFRGSTGAKINDFEQKSCSDRTSVKGDFLLIGLDLPRDELRERLRWRIDQMFTPALFNEVKNLTTAHDWSTPAMTSNIYRFANMYLSGELSLDVAKERAFYADYHLARRQLTWFRRNPHIHWLSPSKVLPFVIKYIQDEQRN